MFDFKIDKSFQEKETIIKELYDVVIIGGGPGAINAALYAARNDLATLMVVKEDGGQLLNTKIIDNYLGFYNISGEDLNNKFKTHLSNFNVDILLNVSVTKLTKEKELFIANLSNEKQITSKTVILATGGNPRKLGVKGEKEFAGRGVSYCVICDGAFYRDRNVVVVGGGNSALEAALDLAKYVKSVHIVQIMDHFTGDKILVDKVKESNNITYELSSEIKEIIGKDNVEKVVVSNKEGLKELEVEGVFIEIGIIPNSELVKGLVPLNKFNEVITNFKQETSLAGLYAIGDVTDFIYKQVITAASQGAVAALSANKYLNE
ncbi:MAG: FAD-dependent oxidoreductase [Acholeplasmataceae bacterium]|nr:FAD-dependent oxidoreductase [Acholeplasmataceae bacterium]MCK9427474.1 FAD-dependent oxidoreductase [Acholeplasmataceae bacterium]